jgi:4-hydroxy-3-polyprenylbenzoate decarboxylase
MRLIVGLSGASGAVYGIRLLQALREVPDVETHLIISAPAKRTILQETPLRVDEVEALASRVYSNRDIGAAPASGSFQALGMAIVPCSIKTACAVASCHGDSLMCRAADVTLKEGRPLLLAVREAPLHVGHLRHLTNLAEMGGIVFPPVPAFYMRPTSLDEVVDHTVGRILGRLGIGHGLAAEWTGTTPPGEPRA